MGLRRGALAPFQARTRMGLPSTGDRDRRIETNAATCGLFGGFKRIFVVMSGSATPGALHGSSAESHCYNPVMGYSRLLLVRQNLPDRHIADIPAEVEKQMNAAVISAGLKAGARIAIGVGSRGIANYATIVRALVAWWKGQRMAPFLFPAMGSHGSASSEGQADVLAHLGITEAAVGCPIVSQLDVVPLGRTEEGIETLIDRAAYESDGVMLVGRVKPHTDFIGKVESGLFKMMAIGLGKPAGAKAYHTHAFRLGLERTILSAGRQVLSSGKILGGLAIIEDAYHNTAKLAAVGAEDMEAKEVELLALAKSWAPRIPVRELDILVVDEFGKNVSGSGFDTTVVNRGVCGERNHRPVAPIVHRLYVRDITDLSYGNAVGIGQADAIHARILPKIDWNATRINSLTSNSIPSIQTPISFSSDREFLEALWSTTGRFRKEDVAIGWIRSTQELTTLVLSENLRLEIEGNPELQILELLPI